MKKFEVVAKDNKSAEIYLYDAVGAGYFGGISADSFVKELNALGKVRDINLYINSDGGDVFDGSTIYSRLVQHPANVSVYVDGLAASIASLIAMAGNKIYISDQGMMMIHNPWGAISGTAEDLRKRADTMDKIRANLVGAYARRTGLTEQVISEMMHGETWMSASESLTKGFVDEIVQERGTVAASSKQIWDLSKYRNPPSWYGRKEIEQPKLVALRAKRGKIFQLVETPNKPGIVV